MDSRLMLCKPTNARVPHSYTKSYAHASAQLVEQREPHSYTNAYGTGMPGRSGL